MSAETASLKQLSFAVKRVKRALINSRALLLTLMRSHQPSCALINSHALLLTLVRFYQLSCVSLNLAV